MLYYLGWILFRIIGFLLGMRLDGSHHIPKSGPFILVSNHQHNFDPFYLGSWIWRSVHFFAKKELWNNPVVGWIISRTHAFPVNRGKVDRNSMKSVKAVLAAGKGLVFFPEGTRGNGIDLQEAKPGLGMLLNFSGGAVPIVPAYLNGTHWPLDCLLRKRRLALIIGKPIPAEEVATYLTSKEGYQALADRMMDEIQKLKNLGGF